MKHHPVLQKIVRILDILVLIASAVIVVMVSFETLSVSPAYGVDTVLSVQLWVCVVFMLDYLANFFASESKWRYFRHNLLFLLVSIPYLNIVDYMGIDLSHHAYFIIRLAPLMRGGYGMALLIWRFNRSKMAKLFYTYLVSVAAIVYFGSILFYSVENGVNPMVTTYWNALWWACMDMTTIGSNIYAVTVAGQIMSVVLAALGMMMFPIFTVYVTSKFQKTSGSGNDSQEE